MALKRGNVAYIGGIKRNAAALVKHINGVNIGLFISAAAICSVISISVMAYVA